MEDIRELDSQETVKLLQLSMVNINSVHQEQWCTTLKIMVRIQTFSQKTHLAWGSQNAMSLTLMLYRWKKFTSIQLPLGKVWIILSTGVEASQSATVARGQNGCHWKVYSLENCIWLAEWKQLKLTFYDRYFVQHTEAGTKPGLKGCLHIKLENLAIFVSLIFRKAHPFYGYN